MVHAVDLVARDLELVDHRRGVRDAALAQLGEADGAVARVAQHLEERLLPLPGQVRGHGRILTPASPPCAGVSRRALTRSPAPPTAAWPAPRRARPGRTPGPRASRRGRRRTRRGRSSRARTGRTGSPAP